MPKLKASSLNVIVCALVLAAKLVLIWRINVNWDEFFYLTHVYEHVRGDLTNVFQLIHVHAFSWLQFVGSHELDQVVAGRFVMWGCLAATVVLLAKLAGQWVSSSAAWFAPLTFLSASPVLRHGASFRADSLLVLLITASLLLVAPPDANRRRVMLSGSLFGVSLAISLKAILLAPLIFLLIITGKNGVKAEWAGRVRAGLSHAVLLGVIASTVCAALLFLHWLTLPNLDASAIESYPVNAARKTLLDAPFLPRWDYLRISLESDWVSWVLLAGGLAIASFRARRAAIFALSLAPLLFYRNAFPYFYVVMLAPAAILAAIAIDALFDLGRKQSPRSAWLPAAAGLPLVFQTLVNLHDFRFNEQEIQKATIEAVHEIFPEPVPYIDHSGMIASFPKVNSFMSSWGIETYRDRGVGFVQRAIESDRPPLLLANAPVLMVGSSSFERLLDEDRHLIEKYYVPYWGAINVAGTDVELDTADEVVAELPFHGRYRLESETDVIVDGSLRSNGSVILVSEGDTSPQVILRPVGADPVTVRLVWADAQAPPPGFLPRFAGLYAGL